MHWETEKFVNPFINIFFIVVCVIEPTVSLRLALFKWVTPSSLKKPFLAYKICISKELKSCSTIASFLKVNALRGKGRLGPRVRTKHV